VAITPKGSAVFYYWTDDGVQFLGKHLIVFSSLHAAAGDGRVRWAALKAIEVIGVPIDELDI
jgi:hypothetical protein